MELWIRSQDKMNLVKVNDVSVNYRNNTQIIANYIPDFIGKEGEYYETLGTYKTKERALEVLDEICDTITKNKAFVLYSNIGDFSEMNKNKEVFQPVYKMPEE